LAFPWDAGKMMIIINGTERSAGAAATLEGSAPREF
jgi:hypothetical protein